MRRAHWLAGALVLSLNFCLPSTSAVARDESLSAVLQGLERDYHVKPKHIPGLWLAKLVVKVAHPRGVSKVDFVLFEDENLRDLSTGPEFEKQIHTMLGAGWKRFVEMDDSKRKERVLIFARPTRRHLELFIFSAETGEAVALFARVNPQSLQRVIDDPSESIVGR